MKGKPPPVPNESTSAHSRNTKPWKTAMLLKLEGWWWLGVGGRGVLSPPKPAETDLAEGKNGGELIPLRQHLQRLLSCSRTRSGGVEASQTSIQRDRPAYKAELAI